MMRINFPRWYAPAAAAMLTCVSTMAAAGQDQIHPTSGGATNPIVIAVLADGYTADQQADFNADAANFLLTGVLEDDYFKNEKKLFRVVTNFKPILPNAPSRYGFKIATGVGNCAVEFSGDTIPIETDNLGIGAQYIVVVGNYPYTVGCTWGKIAYVTRGAAGAGVLEHEFGHMLASLFDEFGLPKNGATPYPDDIPATDERNCWLSKHSRPGTTPIKGCDLFNEGIVHGHKDCRMGAGRHREFCAICKNYLKKWFDEVEATASGLTASLAPASLSRLMASHDPAPRMGIVRASFQQASPGKPPTIQPVLRLLLRFDPKSGTAIPRRGFDSSVVYVPNYRRVGKYVYEIVDGGKFVEFGVLSDHLFKARGYTGSGVQHAMADPAPTDVVVQIPGETIERVRAASRNLSLVMWEILPGFEDKDGTISRDEFLNGRSNDKMMRRTGEVTADVIKKILMTPSP